MEFVAIDFETANTSRDSACAIGLVTVRNGRIIDEYYQLIRPKNLFFDRATLLLTALPRTWLPTSPPLNSYGHKYFRVCTASRWQRTLLSSI